MSKRRTGGIQRRASNEALSRRFDERPTLNWRVVAMGVTILAVVVIAVLVAFSSVGSNPYAGTPQPDDGRLHVPQCEPGGYSSTPATSGCHLDTPAQWGVYATSQDPVQLIHNLEHGGIVIWYQPSVLDPEAVAALTDFVETQVRDVRFKFIVSPWNGPDFDHPIAVTAWRQLLYLDEVNLDAIRGFADQHYGQAPESQAGPPPPG